jgi:F420-dependent oxidoreductase-like protein
MDLRLPAPCMVVLIGPSASGKTTWANSSFADTEIVSSDALRAMVGYGEDDQEASKAAFDLLELIVTERLRRGLTTIIDTMGLNDELRTSWVARANEVKMPAYAVVFETPAEECHRRNKARTRPIPKTVLDRQLKRLPAVLAGLSDEGFDRVIAEQPVAIVPAQLAASVESEPRVRAAHTFGLMVSRFDWPGGPEELAAQLASVAQRAEQAGFRDIWVMDHFRQIASVGRPWEDILESYAALSFIAAHTRTIRLGTLVSGVTHRNPAHLGKLVATLDVLSGGRANCGIGLAWDEEEHAAYGWDFPATSNRYDLLEDTLRMLPLLWGKGSPAFAGRVFSAEELICYPRPIQDHIPILIGGSGEERTLPLVAKYGDACNLFGSPEAVRHKVDLLHHHCAEVGRDPDRVEVTHLVNAMTASSRAGLRNRIDQLRGRRTSVDEFSSRYNAGTVGDQIAHFAAYQEAGAHHSIVSLPDVHLEGGIESFAEVIAGFRHP